MSCKLHIQPRVFIRKGVPADTWAIENEVHFLRRLEGGRFSTVATHSAGAAILVTTTDDHNLITGDVIDISGAVYSSTAETVTRVSNLEFTLAIAYSATDVGSWTFENQYTEYDQIAVDGSIVSETAGDSQALLLGTKEYKNNNFQVTLPNLGVSGSLWDTWKSDYSRCETIDAGLYDADNNYGVVMFGVPARFLIQNTFSDFVQFILDGERESVDLYDFCEVKCFDPILQVADLRGYWDFSHTSKVTIVDTGFSAVTDRSGMAHNVTQSTAGLRPDVQETNNIMDATFVLANTDYLINDTSPVTLDPGLEDFSIIGIFQPLAVASTNSSTIISKADASAGWSVFYDYADGEITLVTDSDTGVSVDTVFGNMPATIDAYMYFVARVDRSGNITMQANAGSEGSTAMTIPTTETIGDDNHLDIGRRDDASPLYLDADVVMLAYFQKLLSSSEKTAVQAHMLNLINRLNA